MKRFYQKASSRPLGGHGFRSGFEILLDERVVKTPAREGLVVPTAELAEAIVAEWNAQGEKIEPRSMPMTGLANAAIDRVDPDPAAFARNLAAYAESDLLCYRAGNPPALVDRQSRAWDPLLEWASKRFDVQFVIIEGVMHRPQPDETLRRLGQTVAARSAFELAALSPLVTIGGSLITALALIEEAIDLETAWSAISLDEVWQAEQWGQDEEAAAVLEARRKDFAAAYSFNQLIESSAQVAAE